MYTALYRAFRPETFDEILGQDHIVKILKNQIKSGKVSHAYLFCGTRGTGKTTTARILAKGVNCLAEALEERPCGKCAACEAIKDGLHMDVIEIDAASNNGVDNIRELRESVKYPPSSGRKKVYIIDEVHMLSKGAFNALLKTLEEPPENVIFILATTEPEKLPATVMSRCMRLDFRRVPERILVDGMRVICSDRGVIADEGALDIIAANADGSVRDGLSILDRCISLGQNKVNRSDILELLGTSGQEVFIELTENVRCRNTSEVLLIIDKALADGKDARRFLKDWLAHYRNLLIVKYVKNAHDMLGKSCENTEKIKAQSDTLPVSDISSSILELSKTISDVRWSTQPRILLELCAVKMSTQGSAETTLRGNESYDVKHAVFDKNSEGEYPDTVVQKPDENAQLSEDAVKSPYDTKSIVQPRTSSGRADKDAVWRAIFEEGEAARGSFNLIRTGTVLSEISDRTFTVTASNPATKGYLEKNKKTIEVLMEKHTGKSRTMKTEIMNAPDVAATDRESEQSETDVEAEAKAASNILGIKVSIEGEDKFK